MMTLQGVVDSMTIKGKTDESVIHCEVCIQGKFIQTRNRKPDARAEAMGRINVSDLTLEQSLLEIN